MITRAELNRRARRLGVQVGHIANDYVLCQVLVSITVEVPELIFRGGTALARAYWPDYRLSEDLDFVCAQRIDAFVSRLEAAAQAKPPACRSACALNHRVMVGIGALWNGRVTNSSLMLYWTARLL